MSADSAAPREAASAAPRAADPLREALLDAAARVIARRGYQGTKIQDIVQEAGLSSGAVYGRFRSKDELAREAIITRSVPQEHVPHSEVTKVADLVARNATVLSPGLNDADALLLEAYVTAGRDPQVAEAVAEADQRWRQSTAPCVTAAIKDDAMRAHKALSCSGYSRTDFIISDKGPVYLETNTLPGLTRASLYPKALKAQGIDFTDFLRDQIELAERRIRK